MSASYLLCAHGVEQSGIEQSPRHHCCIADVPVVLLLQKAVSDDITVAVTDILPSGGSSWPQTVRSLRRQSSSAWLPACFAAPATK